MLVQYTTILLIIFSCYNLYSVAICWQKYKHHPYNIFYTSLAKVESYLLYIQKKKRKSVYRKFEIFQQNVAYKQENLIYPIHIYPLYFQFYKFSFYFIHFHCEMYEQTLLSFFLHKIKKQKLLIDWRQYGAYDIIYLHHYKF